MKIRADNRGFTILELMIATAVFSVILLIATFGLLQVGRMFYKGVTTSQTQEVARTTMDEIAQSIQFSGDGVDQSFGTVNKLCIGNRRYSYVKGRMLSDSPTGDQVGHVLVVDTDSTNCATDTPLPIDTSGYDLTGTAREMLYPGLRLSELSVVERPGGLFDVSLRIARGDNDLLDNPNDPTALCKNIRLGSQFCAVSELKTTVSKRLNVD